MNVLAHQGGWDEILMVAGPLMVFAGVLFLANKRANEKLAAAAAADDEIDDEPEARAVRVEADVVSSDAGEG